MMRDFLSFLSYVAVLVAAVLVTIGAGAFLSFPFNYYLSVWQAYWRLPS